MGQCVKTVRDLLRLSLINRSHSQNLDLAYAQTSSKVETQQQCFTSQHARDTLHD